MNRKQSAGLLCLGLILLGIGLYMLADIYTPKIRHTGLNVIIPGKIEFYVENGRITNLHPNCDCIEITQRTDHAFVVLVKGDQVGDHLEAHTTLTLGVNGVDKDYEITGSNQYKSVLKGEIK